MYCSYTINIKVPGTCSSTGAKKWDYTNISSVKVRGMYTN